MVNLGRLIKEYTDGQSAYIHCLAHCNELIIKDVIGKCSLFAHAALIGEYFNVLAGAYPKGISLFEELKSDQDDNSNTKTQRLQKLISDQVDYKKKSTKQCSRYG